MCSNNCNQGRDCKHIPSGGEAAFALGAYGLVMLIVGAAGEHECKCNKWGAVSVTDRAGAGLGLRLDEFEPLTWRENVTANAELRGRSDSDGPAGAPG